MSTLATIHKQIAELQKKAEAIAKTEAREAAAKARALIAQYGLTAEDVGLGGGAKGARSAKSARRGGGSRKAAAAKPAGVARYRDPATGKTWTGVGRAPTWIAGAADRSAFLIDAPAAPAPKRAKAAAPKSAKAAKVAKPATRRKAGAPAPTPAAADATATA
jgi:DNA-binding protein H-NS